MATLAPSIPVVHRSRWAAWLPLASLPAAAVWLAAEWPAWVFMWALAIAIYAGLKWLTFADAAAASPAGAGRAWGYLVLWPGMDPQAFLAASPHVERPAWREFFLAVGKTVLGLLLLGIAARHVERHPMTAGWIGMAGVVCLLHFGLFHLLSVAWRRAGVDAPPLMNAPLLASSLSDFWGRRWNLAFRDLAYAYVFRPFVGRLGSAGATLAVFLVSGLIHDTVISLSAGAGFGWPTLYFAIQGLGLLCERSRWGRMLGARSGATGRAFCAAVVVGPIGLLFHRPFVERVVAPMLAALPSWS